MVDCPYMQDELLCETLTCNGLFKCAQSSKKICIHLTDVCDGNKDCTSGEDENLCELPEQCPTSCKCLMYAIRCSNKSAYDIEAMLQAPLVYIYFTNIKISQYNVVLNTNNLVLLKWSTSNIKTICTASRIPSKHLQLLDYSQNTILQLTDDCFAKYVKIQVILLSQNKINYISMTTFFKITKAC